MNLAPKTPAPNQSAAAETATWDIVLRDGSTMAVRTAGPDDLGAIERFYEQLSERSRYQRFHGLQPRELSRLMRPLGDTHLALVGELRGEILALAEYIVDREHRDRAEVAFATADALQGHGVGARLLELLAEMARARGVAWFDAYVLDENSPMVEMLVDSGFDVTNRLAEGVYHVELSLVATAAFATRAAERQRAAAASSMKHVLEPHSVAIIGASRDPARIGSLVLHNLRAAQVNGPLYVVHPTAAEIDGIPCHRRVADIAGHVELAVIAVPADAVLAVVDDCIAKGVQALVVITAGFGETGAEGRARQRLLLEKVRAAGIRLVGPNCIGVLDTDPAVRLNATFAPRFPAVHERGNVAIATQSGALGLSLLDYTARRGLGVSSFVSLGNKADVSSNDLIQYWARDRRTDVIALYLESFGNPRTFGRLARRIGREKPIVAMKAGRSQAGMRAASSHTGALATSDAVVEGLFHQAGVVRTRSLEELFDVTALLALQPLPAGKRVAILTNAGGPGILAADACEAEGLTLPALSGRTLQALHAFLPPTASVANPVDMIASASPDDYRRAIPLLLADEGIDALIVIYIPPLVTKPEEIARAIGAAAAGSTKPVQVVFMTTEATPEPLARLPLYLFPESAATALARACAYARFRARPPSDPRHFADFRAGEARTIVDAALARGGGWLKPLEAEGLLAAAGIGVAQSRAAADANEAARMAGELRWPLALKAVGPSIVHKTEVGAVKLGLADEAALRAAYADLERRLGASMTGVVVQEMVTGGVEMMIGAVEDPIFGPLLVCGSGGIFTELLADVTFRLHPLDETDATEMLGELRGAVRLAGFRGAPAVDEAALREALLRLSQLLEVCPEIAEMDVNPIEVLPEGVRAVDVRVRVAQERPPQPFRRIRY